MGETSKAWLRLATDGLWREVDQRPHVGTVHGVDITADLHWLDVGVGDDRLPGSVTFDADHYLLDGCKDCEFDLVYSNYLLQTLDAPRQALQRWIEVTRPGGFIWVIVPDFWLYEHGQWPSVFNPDHKHVFLCRRGKGVVPAKAPIVYVEELARSVESEVEVRRVKRVDTGYDFKRLREMVVQPDAEASIEMVLQKL